MNSFTRTIAGLGLSAALGFGVAACGGSAHSGHETMPGMGQGGSASATPAATDSMAGMPGMTGNGLAKSASGFSFVLTSRALPALRFQIKGADGMPVTSYEPDQGKLMHFYLVRSDLSGFQHVHPTMASDGTWTAPLTAAQPGAYRAYASFIAKDMKGKAVPLVLSDTVTVPGKAASVPLPAPSKTTTVDGYSLTVSGDELMAGMEHMLTVTVAKNGKPVTDLQPYLDTYAHLTAFHQGDLAFAHLHPQGAVKGDHGGPKLSFHAALAQPGKYRLFLQFRTGGRLHTAAITLSAR